MCDDLKKLPKASTDYEKQLRVTIKREFKYVSFLRMSASSSSRKEEFEERSSLPKTSTKKSFAEQRESEYVSS